LRVAGKVEPVFVENIADMPAAIAANAQAGDVVLCMGAGSIGAVPGNWLKCFRNKSWLRRRERAMSMFGTNIDVKALGKVAVLMGGRSSEREVSLMSGAGVLAALQSKGVDAHKFDPAEQGLDQLKVQGFDRCFIALHGRYGEDGTVQGALELLGIPYTGSGVMASSIAMDKIMTKRIWRFEGLPTPDWRMVAGRRNPCRIAALGAPMIVKPARDGSSIGLTKVMNADECAKAYELAAQYDAEVLCEQFIAGDETTCPVLGTGQGRCAAGDPNRCARRQLRLPEQVLHRYHAVPLP
jgi:hypothetical protein